MAAINIQAIPAEGAALTFTATEAGGDSVSNVGRPRVAFFNSSGSAIDVTLVTTQQVEGNLDVDDRVVSVPAGGVYVFPPLDPTLYGNSVSMSYSTHVSLSVAAYTE